MNEEKIRELIAVIDSFHGNQLKDRDDSHIQQEVRVIKEFLDFDEESHSGWVVTEGAINHALNYGYRGGGSR